MNRNQTALPLPRLTADTILIYFNLSDVNSLPLGDIDSIFTEIFAITSNPLTSYLMVIGDVDKDRSPTQLVQLLSRIYGFVAKIHFRIFGNPLFYFSVIFYPYCNYNPFELESVDSALVYSASSFNTSFSDVAASSSYPIIFKDTSITLNNLYQINTDTSGLIKFTRYYENVVLGGTFDHLHVGHKLLLSQSALISTKSVLCGVSGHELITSKSYHNLIQPIEERIFHVENFLKLFKIDLSITCVPLHDTIGPAASDNFLDVIIVSKETIQGAKLVNKKREEKHLKSLEIIVVDLVSALDYPTYSNSTLSIDTVPSFSLVDEASMNATPDTKISSTEIRKFYNRKLNKK